MPMPRLYGISTRTPNAFATGRSPTHASVAVTSGLLKLMDEGELKGVLAHELSHVKNRDTLVMCVAAAIAGAIMMLRNSFLWFGGAGRGREESRHEGVVRLALLLILAIAVPVAVMFIQAMISRTREFGADETGARLTGNPHGLASALEKLETAVKASPLPNANPATAHLFIVNPLSMRAITRLFSTHPPTAERVRRLRSMRF